MEYKKYKAGEEMIMTDIKFLGEDDFLGTMETENKVWRNESVEHGSFTSFDGTKINYYSTSPIAPKAAVVIVHGLGEFFGKYREYTWYLYQAGFRVFFIEHRCHGYSEGKLPEHDLIYIDKYDTYVEDLHTFMEKIVLPGSSGMDRLMIAHSMGGCIGTLFIEKYPDYFKAAILSSPMFRLRGVNYPPIVQGLIGIYSKISGKDKKLAPGQTHFNPDHDFTKSSALSKARFDYQMSQRKADPHYQMWGATFSWAVASMKATGKVIRNAEKIHIPITVMTAGDDHLIDPEGYSLFRSACKGAVFHPYEHSRHEIFNADDESRKQYFADVIDTLERYNAE